VRWCRLPTDYAFPGSAFGANPTRCSRVWNEEVVNFATQFINSPPIQWQSDPLPVLPVEEPELGDVPSPIADIAAQAADLVPMYLDNRAFPESPSEDELIVHFVVPLLRALGWPPEFVAVKWRWIDVAVFDALPRKPENCRVVIEAKRLGAGVEGALDQARGYIEALGVPRDVIVTDGVRYRMYDGNNEFAPIAYANLIRLKRSAADFFARIQRHRGEH
jgi:hypothetical protein